MKIIGCIFLTLFSFNCSSQEIDYATMPKEEYEITAPTYKLGIDSLAQSVYSNLKQMELSLSDKFLYSFGVDLKIGDDGRITDYKVANNLYKFSNVVPNLISQINNWTPAFNKKENKPVDNYLLSCKFYISKRIFWLSINDRNGIKVIDKRKFIMPNSSKRLNRKYYLKYFQELPT